MKETYKPTEEEIKKAEGMMTYNEKDRSGVREREEARNKRMGIEEGRMSREAVIIEITSELRKLPIKSPIIFNEYGFKLYLQVKNPENMKKAEGTMLLLDAYDGEGGRHMIHQSNPSERSRFPEWMKDGRLVEISYATGSTRGVVFTSPKEGINTVVEKLIDKLSEFKNEDKVEEVIENIKNIAKLFVRT